MYVLLVVLYSTCIMIFGFCRGAIMYALRYLIVRTLKFNVHCIENVEM